MSGENSFRKNAIVEKFMKTFKEHQINRNDNRTIFY